MCASVKAYGDEREARGIALGEARGEARGRAEAAKEYQEEIERLKAELAKFSVAEIRN